MLVYGFGIIAKFYIYTHTTASVSYYSLFWSGFFFFFFLGLRLICWHSKNKNKNKNKNLKKKLKWPRGPVESGNWIKKLTNLSWKDIFRGVQLSHLPSSLLTAYIVFNCYCLCSRYLRYCFGKPAKWYPHNERRWRDDSSYLCSINRLS